MDIMYTLIFLLKITANRIDPYDYQKTHGFSMQVIKYLQI
jgi:hypothetical protein